MKQDYERLLITPSRTHAILNLTWWQPDTAECELNTLKVGEFVVRIENLESQSDRDFLICCMESKESCYKYILNYYKITIPLSNHMLLLKHIPETKTVEEMVSIGQFYSV